VPDSGGGRFRKGGRHYTGRKGVIREVARARVEQEVQVIAGGQIGQPVGTGGEGDRREYVNGIPSSDRSNGGCFGFLGSRATSGSGSIVKSQAQSTGSLIDIKGHALNSTGFGQGSALSHHQITVAPVDAGLQRCFPYCERGGSGDRSSDRGR
jgi:hypothetical protein